MKLQFSLKYRTKWGQDVRVQITLHRRRGADITQIFPLRTDDGETWSGEAVISERDITRFVYRYAVYEGDLVYRQEWGGVKRDFPAAERSFVLHDYWKDIPPLQHLYSSAYLNCITHTQPQPADFIFYPRTLIFRVQAPQLRAGQALALVGSQPPLGAWSQERLLPMQRAGVNEWVLSVDAAGLYLPFEYKYVVIDEARGTLVRWEEGSNRCSPSQVIDSRTVLVLFDTALRTETERWKTAGVVVPLFSLRSRQSQGVGDFGDLGRCTL